MTNQGYRPPSKKERKENIIIAAIVIIIAAVMAVASWFTLPDLVETQPAFWDTGVPPFPKLFAVLFPLGLTSVCAIGGINYRKQIWLGLLGHVLYIIFWLVN